MTQFGKTSSGDEADVSGTNDADILIDAPLIMCNQSSAELGKYASNALLATRISFMNEVAAICGEAAADIDQIVQIVGSDPRIGPRYLNAGLGWRGSCFKKDVRALADLAMRLGCDSAILKAVLDVNDRQRKLGFDLLFDEVRHAPDATVGILGLAFKPNTDDVRESPAIEIASRLIEKGVRVRAHDPAAVANARRILGNIEYCDEPYGVALGSDAVLLATEWPIYLDLDWGKFRSLMRGDLVVDGRNALDRYLLSSLEFKYKAFGRPDCHRAPESIVKGS